MIVINIYAMYEIAVIILCLIIGSEEIFYCTMYYILKWANFICTRGFRQKFVRIFFDEDVMNKYSPALNIKSSETEFDKLLSVTLSDRSSSVVFSPVSSTNRNDHHNITKVLLKVSDVKHYICMSTNQPSWICMLLEVEDYPRHCYIL